MEYRTRLQRKNKYPARINVSVGQIDHIALIIKKRGKEKAEKAMKDCEDFMSQLDVMITDQQWRKLVIQVFDPSAFSKASGMNPLSRLTFLATFNAAMAEGRRGEEYRHACMVHHFKRYVKQIGPQGAICSMRLSNKAKHNQHGRHEYTGCAPNLDALCDPAASRGLYVFYRFGCHGDKLPCYTDTDAVYAIPSYCAITDNKKHISEDQFQNCWSPMFDDADIDTGKKTHQCRRQMYQTCMDGGVSGTDTSRMAGTVCNGVELNKVQRLSYVTNPPITALTLLAKGDPKHPNHHDVSWAHCMEYEEVLIREARWVPASGSGKKNLPPKTPICVEKLTSL